MSDFIGWYLSLLAVVTGIIITMVLISDEQGRS